MIYFGGRFGAFSVTLFGYHLLTDFVLHFDTLLAPLLIDCGLPFGSLWLPLAPVGSLLALVDVLPIYE